MTLYRSIDDVVAAGRKYAVIYADPPWEYACWDGKRHTRSTASDHYPTMPAADIARLAVGNICAPDAALLLWATWPTLEDALTVVRAWGFAYKTLAFNWVKDAGRHVGMGYYTRANSEPCLLATRGRGVQVRHHGVRQVITSPAREHSRKPREAARRAEMLFGAHVPRIELFCRGLPPAGWDAMGDEVDMAQETI